MMLALTLSFLLFTTSFAAPQTDCVPPQALYLPSSQNKITLPTEKLQFVTLGLGTQNYTCSPRGTWSRITTSPGLVAEVFDISSAFPSPLFYHVENLTLADWLDDMSDETFPEYGIEQIGQYYRQYDASGVDIQDVFDFTQTYGPNAIVMAFSVNELPSPDPGNINWMSMVATSGDLAQVILDVSTNGGEPPSSPCTPGSGNISVPFAAQYWLFGGNIGSC